MAIWIDVTGEQQEVRPEGGRASFSLQELQAYVGGYIQIIPLEPGNHMVIHEEGKYTLPLNQAATRRAQDYIFPWDPGIHGNVLICTTRELGD